MKTTKVPPTYLKQIPGLNSDKAKAITLAQTTAQKYWQRWLKEEPNCHSLML